jgi:hypothetical protein
MQSILAKSRNPKRSINKKFQAFLGKSKKRVVST